MLEDHLLPQNLISTYFNWGRGEVPYPLIGRTSPCQDGILEQYLVFLTPLDIIQLSRFFWSVSLSLSKTNMIPVPESEMTSLWTPAKDLEYWASSRQTGEEYSFLIAVFKICKNNPAPSIPISSLLVFNYKSSNMHLAKIIEEMEWKAEAPLLLTIPNLLPSSLPVNICILV